MTDLNELDTWLALVRHQGGSDADFFRIMLDAPVFAHTPLSDDNPRLRLIQFRHPDGYDALPFFTSIEKANIAAQGAVRVVEVTGRMLLEMTRGATLILNPNDECCVLFPEEIAALLDHGYVAQVDVDDPAPPGCGVQLPTFIPAGLEDALRQALAGLPYVTSAYLLEMSRPDLVPARPVLLVVLTVPPLHAERATRAVITALQPRMAAAKIEIDLTVTDPASPLPDYIENLGCEPFYECARSSPDASAARQPEGA